MKRHSFRTLAVRPALAVATACALAWTFPAVAADGVHQDSRLSPDWMSANVPNGFTLVATGDLIITEAIYPRLKRTAPDLLKILQSADVTFGNFEGTALDLRKFGGYPEALSGGGWLLGTPKVPADLKAMGFNLVGRANNHTTDWGVKGMTYTDDLLDQAGIVHAGTGQTLAEARAARVLNVAAGRVSLVSLASRFELNARAIDPMGQIPGRPGMNPLRVTRYAMVSPERWAELAKVRDSQPAGSVRQSLLDSDAKTNTVSLFGGKYRADKNVGNGMAFSFSMDERDRKGILRAVRQAKQTSDFSIVSSHTHEPGNYSDVPPDFLVTFAHETIDNGADTFVGHGPHQLRGIEIYKGKPIFYSLGNFFFMYNTLQPLTRDEFENDKADPETTTEADFLEGQRVDGVFKDAVWFESVVAASRYDEHGNVLEVRLYPIELHWKGDRDADRGIPRLASPEVAKRVLERLQRLSQPFGTKIEVRNNIGLIRVGG